MAAPKLSAGLLPWASYNFGFSKNQKRKDSDQSMVSLAPPRKESADKTTTTGTSTTFSSLLSTPARSIERIFTPRHNEGSNLKARKSLVRPPHLQQPDGEIVQVAEAELRLLSRIKSDRAGEEESSDGDDDEEVDEEDGDGRDLNGEEETPTQAKATPSNGANEQSLDSQGRKFGKREGRESGDSESEDEDKEKEKEEEEEDRKKAQEGERKTSLPQTPRAAGDLGGFWLSEEEVKRRPSMQNLHAAAQGEDEEEKGGDDDDEEEDDADTEEDEEEESEKEREVTAAGSAAAPVKSSPEGDESHTEFGDEMAQEMEKMMIEAERKVSKERMLGLRQGGSDSQILVE